MSTPNFLAGNRYRAYRKGPSDAEYRFICLADTKELTRTNEFEDATAPDCDDPTGIPNRKSVVKSRSWTARLSGKVDARRIQALVQDADSETPIPYQFLMDRPAAQGGGTFSGNVFVENLQIGSTNFGITTFSAQFRGDDALVWTPAAA